MSNISDAVFGTGAILKAVSGIIIFVFLIYSMYFTGSYELTLLKGIVAFILLSLFSSVLTMIPFGTTFAPILFEWWWHDVPFWDFSTPAWIVTGVALVANVILLAGIGLSRNQE